MDYEPLTDEMMRDLDADEMRLQADIEAANERAVMLVELAHDAEADGAGYSHEAMERDIANARFYCPQTASRLSAYIRYLEAVVSDAKRHIEAVNEALGALR